MKILKKNKIYSRTHQLVIIPSREWLNKKTNASNKCLYSYINDYNSAKFKITLLSFPCPPECSKVDERIFKKHREINKEFNQSVLKSFVDTNKFIKTCKKSDKVEDQTFNEEFLVELFCLAVHKILVNSFIFKSGCNVLQILN